MPILRRLLLAYSIYNPKIGYCQVVSIVLGHSRLIIYLKGMNFVGGFMILFMQEEDAFWLLDSVVSTIVPNYYDCHLGGLQVCT